MTTDLDFAVELARQSGGLSSEFSRGAAVAASLKPNRTAVTEADLAADRLITSAIKARYPHDLILSEEFSANFYLSSLDSAAQAGDLWIIDPLDGTTNYSVGLPVWGVIITRLHAGWPDMTAIYFPRLDELYTAQRGQGAYLNGERITTIPPDPNRPFSVFACCARTYHKYEVKVPYKTRIFGSAAYSYCQVSRGAALVAFEATPMIWDLAGPWLLVQEAGGEIETLFGKQPFPFQTAPGDQPVAYPTLAAATPEVMERSRGQIQLRAPAS